MNIKKILKNKTAKNAGWLIGGRIIQMAISLLVSLLTARFLGPSNFGLINYGTAYTSFFLPFCTLGINSVLVKEFVDHYYDEGTILGTSIVLRLISSLLSAMIITTIVLFVDAGEKLTQYVVFLCSIGVVFHVFEVFNYWFQSKLQSKVTAFVTLVAYLVTAGYRLILIFTGKSVVYFAFATSVDYICVAVLLYFEYKQYHGRKMRFDWSYGKKLLSKSYHFIIPSIMVAIYGQTDKFMLKQMINAEQIGYYSTALSVCSVWCFVLSAIIDSVYPSIMQANKDGDEVLFKKRNRELYGIVFYVSAFVSAVIALFAPLIIHILYGESYAPAAIPLRIITWYTAFSYLGVARNAWIVSKDRQRYLKYVYFGAALSNVLLNIMFIPRFGASGAAIASLIAQVMTTMIIPFFIPGLKENSMLMVQAILLKDVREKRFLK